MTQPVKTTDGSLTLFSDQYQETYHSIHGAETESRHIFLEASGVAQRLRSGLPTDILEIGFGLGLNCLLSADLAGMFNTPLIFTSVEMDLISAKTFRNLEYQSILTIPEMANRLEVALAGHHNADSPTDSESSLAIELAHKIDLDLLLADASEVDFPAAQYDAIYLDAFSPDINPECWSASFFKRLYASLRPSGNLTTYSAKGDVRRALQQVGFKVQKHPGPPGKREFLVAHATLMTGNTS